MNAPSGGTADAGVGRYEFRRIVLGPTDMAPWNTCRYAHVDVHSPIRSHAYSETPLAAQL